MIFQQVFQNEYEIWDCYVFKWRKHHIHDIVSKRRDTSVRVRSLTSKGRRALVVNCFPRTHLQYNQNTLNSLQLHSPQLLQFQIKQTIPSYNQIHKVLQQHPNPYQSPTTSPVHHQHNQNSSPMQKSIHTTPPPSPNTQPPPSSPHSNTHNNPIDEDL